MSTQINKLFIRLGLIDKVTAPASKIFDQLEKINSRAQAGVDNISASSLNLAATGNSLKSLLSPIVEMDNALGQIESLNVADIALKTLEQTSLKFSIQWDQSAVAFIASASNIKNSINELNSLELSEFNPTLSVPAESAISGIEAISRVTNTTFDIFKNKSAETANSNWVDILAGQTDSAVQIFKNAGSAMTAAFSGLGGVGKAQKLLGLEFTKNHAQMLPMISSLGKLQNKLSSMGSIAKALSLKDAFGAKDAIASTKLLSLNITDLSQGISALGEVKGMQKVTNIASKATAPYQRFSKSVKTLSNSFTKILKPSIEPLSNLLKNVTQAITPLSEKFPSLNKVISWAEGAITGLTKAVNTFEKVAKTIQDTIETWNQVTDLAAHLNDRLKLSSRAQAIAAWLSNKAMNVGARLTRIFAIRTHAATAATWLSNTATKVGARLAQIFAIRTHAATAATWLYIAASKAGAALTKILAIRTYAAAAATWVFNGAMRAMSIATYAVTAATWLFSAALWANPITWVVAGIIALIAVLGAVVFYWDDISNAVTNFVSNGLGLLGDAIDWLIDGFKKIPQWWNDFISWIGSLSPFEMIGSAIDWVLGIFDKIPQWWDQFISWIGSLSPFEMIGSAIDWVLGIFDKIPQWWNEFIGWIGSFNPFEAIGIAIDWVLGLFDRIPLWWSEFIGWLGSFNPFEMIGSAIDWLVGLFDKITQWWGEFTSWLGKFNPLDLISDSFDWFVGLFSDSPDIDESKADDLAVTKQTQLPRGGLIQEISNATSNDSSGMRIENLQIKTDKVDNNFMENELAMVAG